MGNALTVWIAVISLAGTVVTGWLAMRSNVRAKHVEAEGSPYGELSQRVSKLEEQVAALLGQQWVDRQYIRTLVAERPPHLPLPEPIPAWLATGPRFAPTPSTIIEPRS